MSTTCGHLLCEFLDEGCRFQITPHLGSRIGAGPAAAPPKEDLDKLESLLGELNVEALRIEIERRRLCAAVDRALVAVDEEQRHLARFSAGEDQKRSARAALLFDKLRDLK